MTLQYGSGLAEKTGATLFTRVSGDTTRLTKDFFGLVLPLGVGVHFQTVFEDVLLDDETHVTIGGDQALERRGEPRRRA